MMSRKPLPGDDGWTPDYELGRLAEAHPDWTPAECEKYIAALVEYHNALRGVTDGR